MKHQRLVLLIAAVLFTWFLGGRDLWAPNEPYFAEGAREMVVDGKWAVPNVNGVISTDKPPFFFWMIALFSLPFGEVTLWTARLPSVLAGLGTIAITMRLGRRFWGPRTAALAGLVLTVTYMFWEQSRWVQTDAVLCFTIWIALAAFVEYRSGDRAGTAAGRVFWIALALAVLTKGPVGFLLPLGIAVLVLLGDRKLGSWRGFAPWSGPALFIGILTAWMLFATFGTGGEYSVWGALQEHFIDRGIHGMHHKRPPWYYLEVMPAVMMPWTFLLPGALLLAWRRRGDFDRFLLTTACFVVIFFTISTEKRELYVLPALPAFALMVAALTAAVCRWREAGSDPDEDPVSSNWIRWGQIALGALLVGVGAAAPVAAREYDFVPTWALVSFIAVLAVTGLATLHAAWTRRLLRSVLAPAFGFGVFYLLVAAVIWPAFEPLKSARAFTYVLAEETRDYRRQGGILAAFGLTNLPQHFAYYGNGLYTLEMPSLGALKRHLESDGRVFAVVDRKELTGLDASIRDRLRVVAEARLARRQVVLVINDALDRKGVAPPNGSAPSGAQPPNHSSKSESEAG